MAAKYGTYTTLCVLCQGEGIISVQRLEPPATGCCAYCGEEIPMLFSQIEEQEWAR